MNKKPINFNKLIDNNALYFMGYLIDYNLTELNNIFDQLQPFNLSFLQISNNKLSDLPESIRFLTGLLEIFCYNNLLTDLPDSFCSLINLQYLNFESNKLTSLPKSFNSLVNLKELDISNNNFSIFPESICSLTNLKILLIRDNNLTNLPESICSLINLEQFYCDNNNLISIPNSINSLLKLQYFSILNNNLLGLPANISYIGGIDKTSFKSLNDISNDCEYLQFNYLDEPLINLPIFLKVLKLYKPKITRDQIRLPFGTKLYIDGKLMVN